MPDSQTNIATTLGTAWHVQSAKFTTQIGYISGSGSPVSAVTPAFIGQEYFDTANNNWWRAYGTVSADWVELGGESETVTITGGTINGAAIGGTTPAAGTFTSLTANELTANAGTATVAPITLTAGTNLTAAVAGAIEFDGTAFYATAVAASRQQIDAEQFTIASANSAIYNNTGLDTASAAPVFTSTMGGSANGQVTLAAGKTYAFEANYLLTNTGTTSHTWSTLFGGTATFTDIVYSVFGLSGTSSAPATGGLTGFATAATAVAVTAASTSATENVTIQIAGVMTINAGGTLIPQLKASARPGATGTAGVTVLAGSFFRIWEMAGTGTVGDWT